MLTIPEELRRALIPKWSEYIPHPPHPKQQAFLLLDCIEAFYGGAGGGGKSDALLMGALQYVDIPGYAALLLRRTYADLALPEAIMDRAHLWLGPHKDVRWDDDLKTFNFPSGAKLVFGYLEHERDKYRYQSAAFQFVGFDELTQFTQSQYTYLFSRMRRLEGVEIPLRMRAASNPGGVGHEWVQRRFVDPQNTRERVFIPATIDDNPSLDRQSYRDSLSNMDEVDRAQIERGDWTIRKSGRKFKREWLDVIERSEVPEENQFILRYWDLAATEPKEGEDPDYTAGALISLTDGHLYVHHMARSQETPGEVERLIKTTARMDTREIPVRMEQEPGASGISLVDQYARKVLVGFDFQGVRSTGNKEVRANPLSAMAQGGRLHIVRGPWNNALIDELIAFPQKGVHDDQVDALSGGLAELASMYEMTFGEAEWEVPKARNSRPRNLTEYREKHRIGRGSLTQVRRV